MSAIRPARTSTAASGCGSAPVQSITRPSTNSVSGIVSRSRPQLVGAWRGLQIERVGDGRDVLVLADRCRQLDQPAVAVALAQRIEDRLFDAVRAQQLTHEGDDVALVWF